MPFELTVAGLAFLNRLAHAATRREMELASRAGSLSPRFSRHGFYQTLRNGQTKTRAAELRAVDHRPEQKLRK